MSKQLKLDSFWKEKKVASTSPLTTKMMKKRKLEETKAVDSTEDTKSRYKEGIYSYPFWWTKEKEDMLQVESICSCSSLDDKDISWTKKLVEQSSLSEGVLFSSKNLMKQTKQVVHKTGLSKKVLADDEIIRSRKILLKPTSEQKKKIQEWMRITRFVYNLAHHFVNDLEYECKFFTLKTIILTKEKNPEASKYEWLFDTEENKILARDAKDYAIQQYVCNVHSSTESLKEKQTKINKKIELEANMKKRTEKSSQTVGIPVNGGRPSIKWDKKAFILEKE